MKQTIELFITVLVFIAFKALAAKTLLLVCAIVGGIFLFGFTFNVVNWLWSKIEKAIKKKRNTNRE